ncbi:MAG: hypothetical protein AAFV29_23715, partial [Myxococcota bacterium]
FTGVVYLGESHQADRICLREGAFVGMAVRRSADAVGLQDALLSFRIVSEDALAALSDDGTQDARLLAKVLVERRFVSEADLHRAVEAHVRRRLFALYDLGATEPVRVRQGLMHLASFWPVAMDIRPFVAFGMVVRSSAGRRAAIMAEVRGRTVRIVAPYDARRNGYGLPPPVVGAMKALESGVYMDDAVTLPGLSADETAGLLLLLHRMSLLQLD